MKTILYNPIFINPQAYYVFPRLTRYLQPDNESTSEPANYIGTIEVKVIAYGDTTLKRTYTNTDSIDLSEFKNTWIRISLFTKVGSCVLGEWKIGNMESDLPYIDPEVLASLKAVVIVGNKTNNDSDRAIVKNLVDASNPFVISNAAFKLNSGFGGFVEDFTSWDRIDSSTAEISNDGSKIKCINTTLNVQYLFNSINRDIPSFKVKISNFTKGDITYYYRKEDGIEAFFKITPLSVVNSDKVIELPKSYNTVENGTGGRGGFYSSNINIGVTITQIPSFEGAFVTDGVNDLITSTKTVQEMLGGSNEITVVSMIHQIGLIPSLSYARNNYFIQGNNFLTNTINAIDKTGIYGYRGDLSNITIVNDILGDKKDYSIDKANPANIDSVFSVNGTHSSAQLSQIAWYWTIIANKVLTTDEINQVIAYYNLDRTLNPDILCNTIKQGITNDNHAEFGDKLIDFSGNGRDIQLNNIAWDGDSGIGKYNYPNWKVTATIANTYSTIVNYPTVNGTYSINVNGVSELMQSIGLHLEIKYTTSTGIIYNDIKQDGVYSYILPDGATDLTLRFGGIPGIVNEPCNITITQIPSHAGALCLDGVNDFGKVTGMPIYKDYTVIADYIRTSAKENAQDSPILSKSQVVNNGAFVFNYLNINSALNSYSFGTNNGLESISDSERKIYYQSKYVNDGKSINSGTGIDYNSMWLGAYRDNVQIFFNGAIYSLMSFPYSMSEFLIERQLKKHKLGTLYPNMVEFRPVIKHDDRITAIKYYHIKGSSWINLKPGDYIPVGSKISITTNLKSPYTIANVVSSSLTDIKVVPSAGGGNAYDILGYVTDKSPQKINITIEQDENYVQWNPVVESNVPYKSVKYYKLVDTSWKAINVSDYVLVGQRILTQITTVGIEDEVVAAVSEQLDIYGINKNSNGEYNILGITSSTTPQNINITIDEYIRYEDIVQPYPVLLRFNDENGNEVSWGGKFKVGSTITRIGSIADPESNLLNGLYSISGLSLNGKAVTSSTSIVEKQMVFKTTTTYLLDNNEPKCILSPSRLRIPNSSYKLLGYIPDISGHGNHGVIHNSAYAEGSGVNEDGSYQLDGVDDFVTIPTLSSGGKQVLMKVNWQSSIAQAMLYDQRGTAFAIWNSDKFNDDEVDTTPAYSARNGGNTYIDGILNKNILASQLRNITHNIVATNNMVNGNSVSPSIGCTLSNSYYSQMALYDFMLFDEISTDDKIKELNEYVGIEAKVELPPYYWDNYGKTNLDADKATIQQRGVAVGDYDLTNYNHAYDKMSGYGGYEFAKFDNTEEWQLSSASDTMELLSTNGYSFTARRLEGQTWWKYKNKVTTDVGKNLTVKVRTNNSVRINWELKYRTAEMPDADSTLGLISTLLTPNVVNDIILPVKTQEELDSLGAISHFYIIYFPPIDVRIGDEYTVEMLPLYPNGLVYDGVTDYSENANIPAFTDYTYIFKRTLLNKKYNSASVFKGSNQQSGGGAFICDYNSVEPELMIQGYSFGAGLYANSLNTNDIVYGTKNSVNGAIIAPGNNTDVEGLAVGKWRAYRQMVFYKLILYPKTISLLQINFLKNLMERDEIIDLTNPIFIQE